MSSNTKDVAVSSSKESDKPDKTEQSLFEEDDDFEEFPTEGMKLRVWGCGASFRMGIERSLTFRFQHFRLFHIKLYSYLVTGQSLPVIYVYQLITVIYNTVFGRSTSHLLGHIPIRHFQVSCPHQRLPISSTWGFSSWFFEHHMHLNNIIIKFESIVRKNVMIFYNMYYYTSWYGLLTRLNYNQEIN